MSYSQIVGVSDLSFLAGIETSTSEEIDEWSQYSSVHVTKEPTDTSVIDIRPLDTLKSAPLSKSSAVSSTKSSEGSNAMPSERTSVVSNAIPSSKYSAVSTAMSSSKSIAVLSATSSTKSSAVSKAITSTKASTVSSSKPSTATPNISTKTRAMESTTIAVTFVPPPPLASGNPCDNKLCEYEVLFNFKIIEIVRNV